MFFFCYVILYTKSRITYSILSTCRIVINELKPKHLIMLNKCNKKDGDKIQELLKIRGIHAL